MMRRLLRSPIGIIQGAVDRCSCGHCAAIAPYDPRGADWPSRGMGRRNVEWGYGDADRGGSGRRDATYSDYRGQCVHVHTPCCSMLG